VTRLLVSVRNVAEAEAALEGGADWIDLKEPARGAMGPVDANVAQRIVDAIAGRAAVSAAAGELRDWPGSSARELLGVAGLRQLKLGLSGCRRANWRDAWTNARDEIRAAGAELVGVVYADSDAADSPAPAEVAAWVVEKRCKWLLMDTFQKCDARLLNSIGRAELAELFAEARRRGLQTAAAGRLTAAMIGELPLPTIDVVAVRSAACGGDRNGTVCAKHVAALRELVQQRQRAAPTV
jgi:(5-formylfuran-3-yl)methyl phosphate synthase